ncbi:MAG: LUD domain-containing protein [Thermoprotei archaeon]
MAEGMNKEERENWRHVITKVVESNQLAVERILRDYPYVRELASSLRESKLKVIDELESYVDKTTKSIERNGGHAYTASTGEEARKIVAEIVRGTPAEEGKKRTVVMAKSNVAYEIGLRDYLVEQGFEVWETDLGEFLVQLRKGWPAHVVLPSIDLTREEAGKLVHGVSKNVNEKSSIEEIVAGVREFLFKKYVSASVGITGANAISADTGSVVLVENEGNIRMDTVMPRTHVVVTGIDKIVPTLSDAINEAMVQSAYAGLYPPTYINVTTGPSSTADIESHRVSPATGPKELHVILIDNGRMKASRDPVLKEGLLCIKCGRCYFACPVYRELGKAWIGTRSPYNGPTGVIWNYITNDDPWPSYLCTHSGGCKEVCPMKIDLPAIIRYVKYLGERSLEKKQSF